MLGFGSFARFVGAGIATAAVCAVRRTGGVRALPARCSDGAAAVVVPDADDDDALIAGDPAPPGVVTAVTPACATTDGAKSVQYAWRKEVEGVSFKYKKMRLAGVVDVAPDTRLFRFALPSPTDKLNLPGCSTLQVKVLTGSGVEDYVERTYTPCTPNGALGHFDLIVKLQKGGRMTPHMWHLRPGDEAEFRAVMFTLRYKPNRWESVGMICGGTGITPMLQVIRQALPINPTADPYYAALPASLPHFEQAVTPTLDPERNKDRTKLSLLMAARSERHIILRDYIDSLAREFPDRFKVKYCIDAPEDPATWGGYVGHVTGAMVGETMEKPEKGKNLLLLCGPDSMVHGLCGTPPKSLKIMHSNLRTQGAGSGFANWNIVAGPLGALGYDQDTLYRF